MKKPKGLMHKLHRGLAILVFLFVLAPASGAQPIEYTLTEAIESAIACGPAFREHARLTERYRLDLLSDELTKRPAWKLTASATVAPDVRSGALAQMNWQFSDTLSLNVNVPVGAPIVVPPGSGTSRETLSLNWSQPLWPRDDDELQSRIEQSEQHITSLDIREQYNDAVSDVIRSFYQLEQATVAVDIAKRRLDLAEGQAEYALERYESGQIGLTVLQDEQRKHHQARIALQDARLAQEKAYSRLMTLVGGTACFTPKQDGVALHLNDDLAWDNLVSRVSQLLDVPLPVSTRERNAGITLMLQGSEWDSRLLAFNLTYQRALMSQLQSERTLGLAEDALLPSIGAAASISTELQDLTPEWSLRVQGTWDLDPNRYTTRDKARLTDEGAKDQLRQARTGALEAGQSAWLAVSDAMYGLELAEGHLSEAEQTLNIVLRRVQAGLAPEIEIDQAQLEVDRRKLEYGQAQVEFWLSWLQLGHRLGLDPDEVFLLQ